LAGLDQGQLEKIAGFYDCLEVMPPECYRLLSAQERFPNNDVFEMEDIICKTIMLGKRANKLVAAVGNVRVMKENELDAYKILKDDDGVPPLFFRSTQDMLSAFSFLDTQTAHQIVVETPNHIADCCEEIEVLPDEPLYPIIPNAFQTVEALCREQLQALFGDQVPETAKERLEHELSLLRDQALTCSSLLITRYLVQGLRERGRLVSSRGCIAASYVAYLLTIVDIDPLALNIPCETFVGLDGDRGPDIVLNISGSYQDAVIETLSGMIPRTALAYSGIDFGNHAQVTEETAETMISEYAAKYGVHWDGNEQERLQDCLYGVRLHDSVAFDRHLVIASDGDALRRLTPVCQFGDLNIIHHDYHSLENTLFRFELLSTPALNLLQKMEGLTGVSEMNIDIVEAVSLLLQDATNIPEFDTPEAQSIMSLAQPKTLDDLVKVNAMTRSTGAWDENAEMLLRDGVAPFCEVIGTRDDVFNRLLDAGLSREIAFRTSERVRMGKGLNEEQISVLAQAGIPEWYIESCNKILYLFPKAHCAACTALSLKAAWYKTHYPKEYTQAYSEFFPT
jgi:DNA polymerase-3 subunit alpha (Gram-positive type)